MSEAEFKQLRILLPKPMWEEVQARAKDSGKDAEIVAAYLIKYGLGMLKLIDDCRAREEAEKNSPPD